MSSSVTVIEWINGYTAIADYTGDLSEGDTFTIEPREYESDSLFERVFGTSGRYKSIHRSADEVHMKVQSVGETECVLELIG